MGLPYFAFAALRTRTFARIHVTIQTSARIMRADG